MSAYPALGGGPNQWSPHDIKLAMAPLGKNRHYRMQNIQRRHFNSTAQTVDYAATAEPTIETLLARTPAAIAEAQADLPPGGSTQVCRNHTRWLAECCRTARPHVAVRALLFGRRSDRHRREPGTEPARRDLQGNARRSVRYGTFRT